MKGRQIRVALFALMNEIRTVAAGSAVLASGLLAPAALAQEAPLPAAEEQAPIDVAAPAGVTLEEAVEVAFRNSASLRVEAARIEEAKARVQSAETLPFNPEFEFLGGARFGADETTPDLEGALSQELELGGQRGHRVEAARAELQAAEASALSARRLLAADVHLAFADALEARELLAITRAQAELARQLADIAVRRLDAGAGTQLELNIASADAGRAEHALGVAEGMYAAARAALAASMGSTEPVLPVPEGDIVPEISDLPPLADLLAAAEANRADLQALLKLEEAARARIDLARAEAWPNLTVSLFGGREEANTIVGGGFAIPLPFFQRNQGAIAEARATATRTGAEREVARRSVVYELIAAYEQYRAGARALRTLRERVVGTTEESLDLLRRAFESGKATSTDVLVMRRTLFEVLQAVAEASVHVRRARIRIDVAAGLLPLPPSQK